MTAGQPAHNPELTTGTVIDIDPRRIRVRVERADCSRCRSGNGCGASLFSVRKAAVELVLAKPGNCKLTPGDQVLISVKQRSLFRAIAYAYGLPLAGALVAVSMYRGLAVTASDGYAVVAALLGLALGAALGGFLVRSAGMQNVLCPRVVGTLDPNKFNLRVGGQ